MKYLLILSLFLCLNSFGQRKLINHDIKHENGKTKIICSPTPLYFVEKGKKTSTKSTIDRTKDNPRNETSISKAVWGLMDSITANYKPHLDAEITLDGDHQNVVVRGRNKAIQLAEAKAGIKYPFSFAWLDSAKTAQGVISFKDENIAKVYVVKGDYENPTLKFIYEQKTGQTLQRPYYVRENGLVNVYMDGFSGAGTSADPYQITTWAELADMNSHLSSYFILMNNLSSSTTGYSTYASSVANSGEGWTAIGNVSTPFTGNFNGQGKAISNIYINKNAGRTGGFIGYMTSGLITNVGIVNASITEISSTYSGVIAAQLAGGTISNCYSTGTINSMYAGGLVGVNQSTISNCYSMVTVNGLSSPSPQIGGLIANSVGGSITNCYSAGTITSVGGISGGLVAIISSSPTISNCFWDTQTSGQSTSAGGTGKTTAEMKTLSTFTGASWSIANKSSWVNETWYIDATVDYPRLGWEMPVVTSNIKTWNGTTKANVKTFNGVTIGNVKSINALQ